MKERKFKYKKKDGSINDYNLLVLNENTTHFSGIDYNKLSEQEVLDLVKLQRKYEEELKPFLKGFRQFIKDNVLNEEG